MISAKKRRLFHSLKFRVTLSLLIALAFFSTLLSLYYFNFRHLANEQIRNTFEIVALEIQQQLTEKLSAIDRAAKVAGYSTVVQRAMLSTFPIERIQNTSAAHDIINNSKAFSDGIVDILVYADDHNSIYTSRNHADLFLQTVYTNKLNVATSLPDPFFSTLLRDQSQRLYFIYYIPIRNALPVAPERQNAALCMVLYDLESMLALPRGNDVIDGNLSVTIGETWVNTSQSISVQNQSTLLSLPVGMHQLVSNGETHLTYHFVEPQTGWRFVYTAATTTLLGDLFASRNRLFLWLLFGTTLVLGSILVTLLNVSSRIHTVVKDVRTLSQSSAYTRVRPSSIHELNVLTTQINTMLSYTESMHIAQQQAQQNTYNAIIAQQQAEMIAYRSQINPHFLFNTLECIRSMAHYYGAPPLEELISATSKLLEYSLYAHSIVPFQDELSQLQNYVKVISIRTNGHYQVRTHVTPEALQHPVISMIIQPLAENSIVHGFRKTRQNKQPFVLCIRAFVQPDGMLIVRVIDNDCGISPEKLSAIHAQLHNGRDDTKDNSIGLQNIYRRLKLFNAQCGLALSSAQGHYTIAQISIPQAICLLPPGETGAPGVPDTDCK